MTAKGVTSCGVLFLMISVYSVIKIDSVSRGIMAVSVWELVVILS